MKFIAFAATNHRTSLNAKLVGAALDMYKAEFAAGIDVEMLDMNDYEMPIYSMERQEADGVPALAQEFYDKIGAADAVIASFAEHNGNFTVAYKNVFDWASRIDMKVFQGKPAVLMSTSPGPGGGANVLRTVVGGAPFFGVDLAGSFSVPRFMENFDMATGTLTSEEAIRELRTALTALHEKLSAA